ncbi:MAG TPA: hypothetical protein VHA33_19145 [Candidatus Angelobacter sp.]|jgi:hypothetical protein|nr:hypothetical protein [Candidatus Angelobacter sp.]
MKKKFPKRPAQQIERQRPFRRLVEFPEMKGRTLDKVQASTASDYHSLTPRLSGQDVTHVCHWSLTF